MIEKTSVQKAPFSVWKPLAQKLRVAHSAHELWSEKTAFSEANTQRKEAAEAFAGGSYREGMKAVIKSASKYGAGCGSSLHSPVNFYIGKGVSNKLSIGIDFSPLQSAAARKQGAEEWGAEQGALGAAVMVSAVVTGGAGFVAGSLVGATAGGVYSAATGTKRVLLGQAKGKEAFRGFGTNVVESAKIGGAVGAIASFVVVHFGTQPVLEAVRLVTAGAKALTYGAGAMVGALVGTAAALPIAGFYGARAFVSQGKQDDTRSVESYVLPKFSFEQEDNASLLSEKELATAL